MTATDVHTVFYLHFIRSWDKASVGRTPYGTAEEIAEYWPGSQPVYARYPAAGSLKRSGICSDWQRPHRASAGSPEAWTSLSALLCLLLLRLDFHAHVPASLASTSLFTTSFHPSPHRYPAAVDVILCPSHHQHRRRSPYPPLSHHEQFVISPTASAMGRRYRGGCWSSACECRCLPSRYVSSASAFVQLSLSTL